MNKKQFSKQNQEFLRFLAQLKCCPTEASVSRPVDGHAHRYKLLWTWFHFQCYALRIEYRQKQIEGEKCLDPCQCLYDTQEFARARMVGAVGDYFFAILQLLIGDPCEPINGFECCRDWAELHERRFPFQSPLELMERIFQDEKCRAWEAPFERSHSEKQNPDKWEATQEHFEKNAQFERKFVYKRLSKVETDAHLKALESNSWDAAWIAAVYNKTTQPGLSKNWNAFVKAHDKVANLWIGPPSSDGQRIRAVRFDRHGNLVSPQSRKIFDPDHNYLPALLRDDLGEQFCSLLNTRFLSELGLEPFCN